MSTSPVSKYDALLNDLGQPATVTPREVAHRAAATVQTSLFSRLRRARGASVAGRLAWMLVRAGQGDHRDSGAAHAALQSMGETDLRGFLIAACGARDSLPDPAASALAGEVARAIESAITLGRCHREAM